MDSRRRRWRCCLMVLAYVVAIPFGAALGPAANRAAKAVSNGACAEVVARKVATVRWAAAALCGVHPALGLYCAAWFCSTADGGPLWAAALSSLPSLASAATARRAWSPEPLAALVCLGLGVGRRRRICRRLGALWAAYGAAGGGRRRRSRGPRRRRRAGPRRGVWRRGARRT